MRTQSIMRFGGLVISEVGRGLTWRRCCAWLLSTQAKCIWLVAWCWRRNTTSNYWIGCNFKPLRGHTFMTVTKNDQFCDLPRPLRVTNSADMWQILRPPTHATIPIPCVHHLYDFFVLEKITILLFERNKPIIKILLKEISKPCKYGSSVKVNGILYFDAILWNFMTECR